MSYSHYPMPTPSPTPEPFYKRSPSPYHYDGYPSQTSGNQVVHYDSNRLHSSQSLSTINSQSAQQLAHHSQIMGTDVALIVGGRRVTITKASINAFCNDFVSNELADSAVLTPEILDGLAKKRKISIHHSEKLTGNVLKSQFATELPRAAISASVVAAVGDFSQFRDIIDTFFKYEYTDAITSHNSYSTHYYANDEYTVTGCFLSRSINKKNKVIKASWTHGKFTDIKYETHCYMFTFKVAQAATFIQKYLGK